MYLFCNSKRICKEMNDTGSEWGEFKAKDGIAVQWRKANAVHRWFAEHCLATENCAVYEVDVEDLCQLHDACREVLDSTELEDAEIQNGWVNGKPNIIEGQRLADPTRARELMPTQEGFFFGPTDYDQWYWQSLEHTASQLGKLLELVRPDSERGYRVVADDEPDWYVKFYYSASW